MLERAKTLLIVQLTLFFNRITRDGVSLSCVNSGFEECLFVCFALSLDVLEFLLCLANGLFIPLSSVLLVGGVGWSWRLARLVCLDRTDAETISSFSFVSDDKAADVDLCNLL